MVVRELLARFGFDIDERPLNRWNQQVGQARAGMNDLGRHLVGLTAAFLGFQAVSAVVEDFGQFEQVLNNLQGVSEATAEEFDALKNKALEMGKTVGSTNAAQGMVELAKAGLSAAQTMEAIEGTMALATAGEVSVAKAATIATDTMNAFQMVASDMPMIADVMSKAVNVSSIGMEHLADSMAYAAPVAKQFGLSFKETAAYVALLGSAGIKGSMAGTGLTALMTRLVAPSKDAGKYIKELGIKVKDGKGNLRSFTNLIMQLQKATAKMDSVDRGRYIKEIFGDEAMKTVGALMNLKPDKLRSVVEQVDKAGGTAADLTAILNRGLLKATGRFWNTLDSFIKRTLLKFAPALTDSINGATYFVGGLLDMASGALDAAEKSGTLERVLQGLKLTLTLLAPGAVAVGVYALAAAISMALTPAVVAFIGTAARIMFVAALVAALVLVVEDLVTWLNGGDAALGDVFDTAYDRGYEFMEWLEGEFTGAWDTLYDRGYAIMDAITAIWDGLASGLGAAVGGFMTAIGTLIQMAVNGAVTGVQSAMSAVTTAIATAFGNAYATIAGWVDQALAKIAELGTAIAGAARNLPVIGGLMPTPSADVGNRQAPGGGPISVTNQVGVTVPPGTTNPQAIAQATAGATGDSTRAVLGRAKRQAPKPVR